MNYQTAEDAGFTVSSSATKVFTHQGKAIYLSVWLDGDEKRLNWKRREPNGERPRCVDRDVSFYFDDATASDLKGATIFAVNGPAPTMALARARLSVMAKFSDE